MGPLVRFSSLALTVAIVLSPLPAWSVDLGQRGAVFEIVERDLLDAIQSSIAGLEASGELDKMNAAFRDRSVAKVMRPKPVELPRAAADRSFVFDPAIVVQEDILDHAGNIIASAGTVVNPLEHMGFPGMLVFLDGDDDEQLEWALRQYEEHEHEVFLVMTSGSPVERMRETKTRFYFDQGGFLVETLGVQAVPARFVSDGNVMQGEELSVETLRGELSDAQSR